MASYDPNIKTVYPAGEGAQGEVAPNTTFTYTVHFQNTGNYPATNIYILDTLDTDLDISTLEILSSTHTMNPIFFGGNKVKFDFPNINLIDSTTNEPLSHGSVTYRIKAKTGLANGTEIKNTAHIYFDYNAAVVTNTTLNTINISLNVNETISEIENTIYPNPVSDMVNISFNENVNGLLQVRDITGRIVYSTNANNTNFLSLNVASWNTGMYEISIAGTPMVNKRFIVAK
jgi:fimbrial isopeptide formation D2 family protein